MSTARFNTLQNAAGTKSVPVSTVVDGSAKAWVNFNGTGTVAIRASFNVTSITDVGVGDYLVNFTTPMPDENFSYSHAYSSEVNVQHGVGFMHSLATTGLRINHFNTANGANTTDKSYVFIAVFR